LKAAWSIPSIYLETMRLAFLEGMPQRKPRLAGAVQVPMHAFRFLRIIPDYSPI